MPLTFSIEDKSGELGSPFILWQNVVINNFASRQEIVTACQRYPAETFCHGCGKNSFVILNAVLVCMQLNAGFTSFSCISVM